jgi:hypothetical protein
VELLDQQTIPNLRVPFPEHYGSRRKPMAVSPHLKDELAAEVPRLAQSVGLDGLR